MANSAYYKEYPEHAKSYSQDEQSEEGVALVWNKILPQLGFRHLQIIDEFGWGIAKKI